MEIILIFLILTVTKAFIFKARDEKWWKALIPGYNKYILGKLCDSKKLGIFNAVISSLTFLVLIANLSIEAYVIQNFATLATVPENINQQSAIYVTMPEVYVNIIGIFGIVLVALGLIYFITWAIMMRKFSVKQDCSSWWMFVWMLCPIICYIYFAIHKTVYIPGTGLVTTITRRETCERHKPVKASRRRRG